VSPPAAAATPSTPAAVRIASASNAVLPIAGVSRVVAISREPSAEVPASAPKSNCIRGPPSPSVGAAAAWVTVMSVPTP